ncbi:GNAT family N-acetyltransferase [Martelella limonii]|uniref:GNAT family N-acetyltransferase n=1 Tax=Martelella limonii TaxID=1647649 RepID=UPI001580E2AA|nr:GNAT family N-acetyltransferase [Martelella limonii]
MSIIRKDLGQRPPARLKSKLSVVQPGKAVPDIRLEVRSGGEFSLYSQAPDHMEAAMDRLAETAIERNIFQTPAFLLPALGESHSLLRVALMEDGSDSDDSLTALMTFSVRGNGSHLLAHAIGDIGYHAPLISRHRPMATLDQLFEALAGSLVNLPGIAVFPHLLADGAFMRFARAVAAARGLAFRVTHARRRRALSGTLQPNAGLSASERALWQEHLQKWEALNRRGKVGYRIARNPSEAAGMLEDLSALTEVVDEDRARFRALLPTARKLALNDQLRIHALYLDGDMIAAAVQPLTNGEAWIWQVFVRPDMAQDAVDEQLIMRLTEWNGRDANIAITRTAPGAGPYLAERFWPVDEGYATLMVAIRPGMERALDALARDHRG